MGHLSGSGLSTAQKPGSTADQLLLELKGRKSALITGLSGTGVFLEAAALQARDARTRVLYVRPPLDLAGFLAQVAAECQVLADTEPEQAFMALTAMDPGCDHIALFVEDAHLIAPETLHYVALVLRTEPSLQVVFAGRPEIDSLLAPQGFSTLRHRLALHLALPAAAAGAYPAAPAVVPSRSQWLRQPLAWVGIGMVAGVMVGTWLLDHPRALAVQHATPGRDAGTPYRAEVAPVALVRLTRTPTETAAELPDLASVPPPAGPSDGAVLAAQADGPPPHVSPAQAEPDPERTTAGAMQQPGPPDTSEAAAIRTEQAARPESSPQAPAGLAQAPVQEAFMPGPVPAQEVQPAPNAPEPAILDAPLPTPRPSPARVQPAVSAMLADAMIRRADALLHQGDVSGARLLYERAAGAGSGLAAAALGNTFNPAFLKQAGVVGLRPDSAQAAAWYRRALELGNEEARVVLQGLQRDAGETTRPERHP